MELRQDFSVRTVSWKKLWSRSSISVSHEYLLKLPFPWPQAPRALKKKKKACIFKNFKKLCIRVTYTYTHTHSPAGTHTHTQSNKLKSREEITVVKLHSYSALSPKRLCSFL